MIRFHLEDRNFGGRIFRPRPEIYISEAKDLVVIATPWGPREAAKRTIDRMLDYIALARDDRETTSPFERLSCLSPMGNNLRIATFLANELIYRDDNRDEFHSGVEVLALASAGNEVVWMQVGGPQIYISRQGRPLVALGSQPDLSFDMSGDQILPPLPSQMLGLDSTVNVTLNSFRARQGDQLVLLSHSRPTSEIYRAQGPHINLNEFTRLLSSQDSTCPFWLGHVSLKTDHEHGDIEDKV